MSAAPPEPRRRVPLPRAVRVLGVVSLLADVSSDMVMPLLPIFLTTTLGAGPAAVGVVEGVAEATASLVKLGSGRLADLGFRARLLATAGYALAAMARPFIALAHAWTTVLGIRFTDRIGKGIRTAPRDALLAASVDGTMRGRAFGFHRSMDHVGAALGPLVALALMASGLAMRSVFALSVVPGLAAAALVGFGLADPATPLAIPRPPPLSWRSLDVRVRTLVIASGLLALGSVPDAFLVLWLSGRGVGPAGILLAWSVASAVRSLTAWPAGWLSDHVGRRPVFVTAWALRAACLACMPGLHATSAMLAAYFAWCALTAATEGAERALIGDAAPAEVRGTAFGVYHLTIGLCALPGAALLGVLWQSEGMGVAFVVAAGLTVLAAGVLGVGSRRRAAA